MYIVHIASELTPIAKVGGLGDVVHGLSKEQIRNGHRAEVILPKYDLIDYRFTGDLSLEWGDLWTYEDGKNHHNSVFSAIVDHIPTYLIEVHHDYRYFDQGTIYECNNNIERFCYFCKAALDFIKMKGLTPDVIHLHDWPTAVVAPLLKMLYDPDKAHYGSSVLTIHNIEHQGKCSPSALNKIGLHGYDLRRYDQMQDPNDSSCVNLLKGGIVFSDWITTVSPNYAREIQIEEMGFGLASTVRYHNQKLNGILNGIELDSWNPAKDHSLAANYPANGAALVQVLDNKKKNKWALFEKLQLKQNSAPLIVCVTRLVKQKAPWLIQTALHYTLEKGGSFILVGATSDGDIEKEFAHIRDHYHRHPHLYVGLAFDDLLARQVFASGDAIIIPSLFEPCGLTQMIAMRYGTVPIARKTGGLADTVFDAYDTTAPKEKRTGFTFSYPTPEEIRHAIDRVFDCFYNHPDTWKNLIKADLNTDLSWRSSESEYRQVYQKALKKSA